MAVRNKSQPSDLLPQVATDYIATLVKKMRYRRVRQDVKAELHAHFADALADCPTHQERSWPSTGAV